MKHEIVVAAVWLMPSAALLAPRITSGGVWLTIGIALAMTVVLL